MEERLSGIAEPRARVDLADSTGVQESRDLGGGAPEHHQGERERERERTGHQQDRDIVQHSASEQAQ